MTKRTANPLRILCLANYFGAGGASQQASLLADLLAQRGHTCEAWFLMSDAKRTPPKAGIRILYAGKPNGPLGIARLLTSYRRALMDFRPDAIFGFYPFSNVLSGAAKLIGSGAPKVVAGQHNPAQTQSPLLYHLEMFVGATRLYDANICVSRAVANTFLSHPATYQRKIKIVHNGVPPLERVWSTPDQSRQRLGLPSYVTMVGNAGRLHPQKNLDFLLDVIADPPDVHLALAGGGSLERQLRDRSAALGLTDRVHFLGELPAAEMPHFYRTIDVFAFPSLYEGFPRALIEAMSSGVPVIAADIESLREAGEDAALYLPYDANIWRDALMRLASNVEVRNELVRRGRHRADSLTLSAMVDGYLAVLGDTNLD